MRKTVLLTGLLLTGCGVIEDPCTGVITEEHNHLFTIALELGKELEGLTKYEAQVQVGLSCIFDLECQECFESLIDKVYE